MNTKEAGARGGAARMQKLTKAERSALARRAITIRWQRYKAKKAQVQKV